MKLTLTRETLLRPLAILAGLVARRHTQPILSHLRLEVKDQTLTLTASDLEIEVTWALPLEHPAEAGSITLPAKKLADICKSLGEGALINIEVVEPRALIRSGRSRFALVTLPASDFPGIQPSPLVHQITLPQKELLYLIQRNESAMARQDVRYYLNGMYFELQASRLRVVATDGHRLSLTDCLLDTPLDEKVSLIVPAKAVHELAKLLDANDEPITLSFGTQHFQVKVGPATFLCKQIEGRYPDYEGVIPRSGNKRVICHRLELRQMLSRTAILANEKFQGVRLNLTSGSLSATANNPEQEQAEETMEVDYSGEALEIGFNVAYLIDVMDHIGEAVEQVQVTLSDAASSILIQPADGRESPLYVIMPMRL